MGRLGYGRYDDGYLGCPRAKSDMTPCVARDGGLAADSGDPPVCVGCGRSPYELLVEAAAALADLPAEPEAPLSGGVG